ncbi:HEAT repeat domain-containing protein [Photobacterium sp. J15]|uniref:HEAT repeat domain-containing protein n=1 Tax=Photobacterium sp. J15 TaxID=265901 RepID=UPI0007E37759|nr:HEAT repeat domain-containing protein [Photobacterium sp. J15]
MKKWLCIQTIAFESISFYIVFNSEMTAAMWLSFLGTHAIASASFAALSWLLLPTKFKFPLLSSASFLFIINFLMPLFGIIGTACALLVALHLPRKQNLVTWQPCEETPLPQNPGELLDNQFGAGALRDILLFNNDQERRLLAVSAIRHLPRQQAVPLLQLALKDLSDDVRLLAYASLEDTESRINESLVQLKEQFKKHKQADTAFEIAQQYWELCYLGIADGIIKKHYLSQAERYLKLANQITDRASYNLLLGRVMLEQNKAHEAIEYLTQALDGGLLVKQVAPYMAEAAYIIGDYPKTRHYISYFPQRQGDKLSQIREYWS